MKLSILVLLLLIAWPAIGQTQSAVPPNPVISAQLTRTLDAKHVKAGDLFEARLLDDLQYGPSGQRTVVPRNSKLVGHITECHAWRKGSESRLGVMFDSAVGKDGVVMKIDALILGFQPPAPPQAGPIRTIQNTDNSMARAAGPVSDGRGGYTAASDPVIDSVGTQTDSLRISRQARSNGWHSVSGGSRGNRTAVLLSHQKNARLEKDSLIYLQLAEPSKE